MLDRKPDKNILPYVDEHEIAFLAYSSLGQGLLTGSVGPDRIFNDGDQRNYKARFSVENMLRIKKNA